MVSLHAPAPSSESLSFRILDQQVVITCKEEWLRRVVGTLYGACIAPAQRRADLDFLIEVDRSSGSFRLTSPNRPPLVVPQVAELVFRLDKALTIALQERRPDLLFLHAAALERDGCAYVLVGESGHGKSTTAWGLSYHGFRYLSDELGPVDLGSMSVEAYPHALCLKRRPPLPYRLPGAQVLDLGATIHVPVSALPGGPASAPCPLGAVLFVRYQDERCESELRALGAAEAAARLYVSTLNPLAHPAQGIDAVLRVVRNVPCFSLDVADLASACGLVSRLALRMQPHAAALASGRSADVRETMKTVTLHRWRRRSSSARSLARAPGAPSR